MGNCGIHLMGSHASVDMITEDRLGRSLSCKLDAVSATYAALTAWEDAYVNDIRGNTSEAVSKYDQSIETSALATSKWKLAEFQQSELIAYFTSLPRDLALRQSVADALSRIDFAKHMKEIAAEGRFPSYISIGSVRSMIDLGTKMFSIDNPKSVMVDGEDPIDEIINLFMIDLHQIRTLKLKTKETLKTLEENRVDVVRSQLFERVGSALSIEKELYPLTMVTAQLRVQVVNLITYFEAYGSYVSRALIEAKNDDTWAHVKAYLDA